MSVAIVTSALLLGGCSFQAALDNMVPRARQAELVALAKRFCTDPAGLGKELHPELVASLRSAEAKLPGECPGDGADWRLGSYRWDTNVTDVKRQQEEVLVIGAGKGKWTSVSLRLYGENDAPKQVIKWQVAGSTTPPEALAFIDQYDATMRAMRFVAVGAAIAIVGLLYWFIRRRRAKRAA